MGADHRAFLDATLPYLDVVYQVARQAAGPGQEPEDLVQETYLRAYAGFGSYRGGNTRAWLAAICLNAARSESRRRRRRPREVPAPGLLDELPAVPIAGGEDVPDVADVVIAGLDAQVVSRCLGMLPEPQRASIVLMMWPGTPPGRRRRRWAARGGRCWPGCTAAGAGWPSCWRRRG